MEALGEEWVCTISARCWLKQEQRGKQTCLCRVQPGWLPAMAMSPSPLTGSRHMDGHEERHREKRRARNVCLGIAKREAASETEEKEAPDRV